KKPLGVNLNLKQPNSIEIFIDRSLGRKIAEPLIAAGVTVHLHDDYFEQGANDEVWLTEVGQRKWSVLTKDKRIRHRAIEREALLGAKVKAFFFMSGNVPFNEMAEIVVKALPRISRIV